MVLLVMFMSKWISVKDRLPENYEEVLVRGYEFLPEYTFEIDGTYIIAEDLWHDFNGCYLSNVTHWQPLPKPPDDDENRTDV